MMMESHTVQYAANLFFKKMTWQSTYKKFLVHYYVGKNLDVKLCTRRKSLDLRRTASFPLSKKCKRLHQYN